MKSDFFALYDALSDSVTESAPVLAASGGDCWMMAEWEGGLGLGMHTAGRSRPPMFPEGIAGLPLKEAAKAAASWHLEEASYGLAAANAFFNTPARMEALESFEPYENYATAGIELAGKTVALIGHMRGPKGLREQARAVYVLERNPQDGDYPDAACDWILPQCDLVLLTGSSLVNKTLPHLLSLCERALTILIGPSVPMCPALLDFGIDRLSGLVVTDCPGMAAHVRNSVHGNPYRYGQSFLLKRR